MLDTYANERHTYGFPRVVGVLLDGKTQYDWGNDGDSQALGGCSVRAYLNARRRIADTAVPGQLP
jgi:hypothetical protein